MRDKERAWKCNWGAGSGLSWNTIVSFFCPLQLFIISFAIQVPTHIHICIARPYIQYRSLMYLGKTSLLKRTSSMDVMLMLDDNG
jgi:hypothetical protein